MSELQFLVDQLRAQELTRRQLAIIWMGQSAVLVRAADALIFIDPFLSAHPERLVPPIGGLESVRGIDALACTHEHWDHLDLPTVAVLARASGARVIVPAPIVAAVQDAGVARDAIVAAEPDAPIAVGHALVHPVPARHGVHVSDAYTFGMEISAGRTRFLGYVVDAGGARAYHAGDTLRYDGHADLLLRLRVDVALLPINGRDAQREARDVVGNLNAHEAVALAADARAKVLVPMHFDMFAGNPGDPADVVRASLKRDDAAAVVVLRRGEPFVFTAQPRRREVAS